MKSWMCRNPVLQHDSLNRPASAPIQLAAYLNPQQHDNLHSPTPRQRPPITTTSTLASPQTPMNVRHIPHIYDWATFINNPTEINTRHVGTLVHTTRQHSSALPIGHANTTSHIIRTEIPSGISEKSDEVSCGRIAQALSHGTRKGIPRGEKRLLHTGWGLRFGRRLILESGHRSAVCVDLVTRTATQARLVGVEIRDKKN